MHKLSIPQAVIDRVVARRGREHCLDDLEPARTALVVVDMQNAFMKPGVAHALCLTAQEIVPNINRLARAVREPAAPSSGSRPPSPTSAGELVRVLRDARPERHASAREALTATARVTSSGPTLDVRPGDLIVDKNRYSAFIQGSSDIADLLRERGLDTRADHRHRHQRVLRIDRARRDDAQFQDRHGHGRERRLHR